ncbi:hypothetical protein OIU84_027026 [Salix udensis]|uniref:Ubiquinol oxidase n=1 Tax=Salix udensis TaxID=889485 RepID=A0AAD6PB23_9ROSI|nr:hypothetical protein OIU84_027026 [Salix udensis]
MVENKRTEEIEGISLDISKLSRQIHLKPDAFAMMDGLRFLKFYFSHFSEDNKDKMLLPCTGLQYLSNKLIYLHWDGFPSKSLPQTFCAEHLVELNLSRSKVEKLWTGVQRRHMCHAVLLETVAAVPGVVGGMLLHCKSLRRFEQSGGIEIAYFLSRVASSMHIFWHCSKVCRKDIILWLETRHGRYDYGNVMRIMKS